LDSYNTIVTKTKVILMSKEQDQDFIDIIDSVFPSSIPKQFLEKVDVHLLDEDGNTTSHQLKDEELPVDFPVDVSFAEDPSLYDKVSQIDIYVNVSKVKKFIKNKVTDSLKNIN